ncbi:uncharacterized protein FIBRA_06565 [Fibroporia radiculosa]|uniref:Uncharacterized protein n=1 Tax=Fibroporia radiculosa TaxID=599839 RepID=J4H452_9APHY|nr:uncharacterized protein FIBRA_06565 [Fibroporia radiculosa]CCM04389.1 predicted protein [Fibroporia radiculosa]
MSRLVVVQNASYAPPAGLSEQLPVLNLPLAATAVSPILRHLAPSCGDVARVGPAYCACPQSAESSLACSLLLPPPSEGTPVRAPRKPSARCRSALPRLQPPGIYPQTRMAWWRKHCSSPSPP